MSRWMLWVKHSPSHNPQESQEGSAVTASSQCPWSTGLAAAGHEPNPGPWEQRAAGAFLGRAKVGRVRGNVSAVELHWVTHPGDSAGCPCTSPARKVFGAGPRGACDGSTREVTLLPTRGHCNPQVCPLLLWLPSGPHLAWLAQSSATSTVFITTLSGLKSLSILSRARGEGQRSCP